MPVTKSATRALRKDRTRTATNVRRKRKAKRTIDNYKENLSQENLSQAISQVDKLTKNHLIHKNKASRMKSNLTKLFGTVKVGVKSAKKKV